MRSLAEVGAYNKQIIPEPELKKSARFAVDENGVVWDINDRMIPALRLRVAWDNMAEAAKIVGDAIKRIWQNVPAEFKEAFVKAYEEKAEMSEILNRWGREELKAYLEFRGFAVHDDESTEDLREAVRLDMESEE